MSKQIVNTFHSKYIIFTDSKNGKTSEFYAFSCDNEEIKDNVDFPRDGIKKCEGISRLSKSVFLLEEKGEYKVDVLFGSLESGELGLTINGVLLKETITKTSNHFYITVDNANSSISLINAGKYPLFVLGYLIHGIPLSIRLTISKVE